MRTMRFTTDTATMCVFDLECLKYRLSDTADWWTIRGAELDEVNKGNVALIGLGADGTYSVQIFDDIKDPVAEVHIWAPSGRVFIGAGEEVTSDGLEPEGIRGGGFIEQSPGACALLVKKLDGVILVCLKATDVRTNNFSDSVRIGEE